jgi:SAM-dependent methyltransferase
MKNLLKYIRSKWHNDLYKYEENKMKNFLKKFLLKINPLYRKIYFLEKYINIIDTKINTLNTILGILEDINSKIHIILNILKYDGCVLLLEEIDKEELIRDDKANGVIEDYINMQKKYYEDVTIASDKIVGNYDWHENYPYETFLLYRYGDIRKPIFENFSDRTALDFACGPGRMIRRMRRFFAKVDGCDIAQRLLDDAKLLNPDSHFFLTSGQDLGLPPLATYDFIYCTISMQHIACYSIRMKIIKLMKSALTQGGCITLQLGYNRDFPYVTEKQFTINKKLVTIKARSHQADYIDDAIYASTTNGGFDVGIGRKDIQYIKKDITSLFGNSEIWFSNVDNYYDDLSGATHDRSYWAKDWIFIHAKNI